MEKDTPAMAAYYKGCAAYYKGCMEGLDMMVLDTTNPHCLHVNEVNDAMAYFAMKEILNDHLCEEMGWA